MPVIDWVVILAILILCALLVRRWLRKRRSGDLGCGCGGCGGGCPGCKDHGKAKKDPE